MVDNGSTDAKTLKMLVKAEESGQIRVIRDDRQFNWSRLNNLAVAQTSEQALLFLNNDAELLTAGWDSRLLRLPDGGHQRVLADPRVIDGVLSLLAGRSLQSRQSA